MIARIVATISTLGLMATFPLYSRDTSSVTGLNSGDRIPTMAPLSIYCNDGPPFQTTGDSGELEGFAVEVVKSLQARLEDNSKIEMVPWARGYSYLLSRPNVMLFSVAKTVERESLFHWVGPLAVVNFAFFATANSSINIRNLAEAKKMSSIGVNNNDAIDVFLTQAGFTNLERINGSLPRLRMLMAGRLPVIAAPDTSVDWDIKRGGFEPKVAKQLFVFLKTHFYIAISNSTAETIVKNWQLAFEKMTQDGDFQKLHRKYFQTKELP